MNYLTNMARSKGDPKVLRSGPSSMGASDRVARGLGWFSIALGVAELVAAERIARALGMRGKESLIRAFGMREIGSGILSLSIDKQAGLWSRVAGDGLDIAALLTALRQDNPKRDNVVLALAAVVGVTMIDFAGAQRVTARHARGSGRPRDYGDRSGFPGGLEAAKGLARAGLETPEDMRAAPASPSAARARPSA